MADKMGIKLTDDDVDKAIAGIAAQNKLTVDQLRSRLAYDGLNYRTYRAQIRKEMMISEVRNSEVRRRVPFCHRKLMRWPNRLGRKTAATLSST